MPARAFSFPRRLALVGDFAPDILAHQAIPRALELAQAAGAPPTAWEWIPSTRLADAPRVLADFAAIWAVPGSPYQHPEGVLEAIRFARETGRPFLGTCGGFQHAVIEFARNVAGLPAADHAETNPDGSSLLIVPLDCSLVEKTESIHFVRGSLVARAYAASAMPEGYHCRYGFNRDHRDRLAAAGLIFSAFNRAGEIRAIELPTASHPFFLGTLFQPERAALQGRPAPLVEAFLRATSSLP